MFYICKIILVIIPYFGIVIDYFARRYSNDWFHLKILLLLDYSISMLMEILKMVHSMLK